MGAIDKLWHMKGLQNQVYHESYVHVINMFTLAHMLICKYTSVGLHVGIAELQHPLFSQYISFLGQFIV